MKTKKGLLIPVIVILIVFIFFGGGLFKISDVNISISDVQCTKEEEIQKDLGVKGQNIFFLDKKALTDKLMKKHLCIKEIKIEKKYPHKLQFEIIGRKPFVVVGTISPSPLLSLDQLEASPSSQTALLNWEYVEPTELFITDEGGFVFTRTSEENLPLLLLSSESVMLAQQLDKSVFEKISEVVKKITEGTRLSMKKVDHTLQVKINLDNRDKEEKIVFSLERDIFKQLASLQLILQKAKIDRKNMEIIDLRFDKPVVKFLPDER